jgi:hypothetical protein
VPTPTGWHIGAETYGSWQQICSVFCDLLYCILIGAFCWLKYEMQKKKLQIKQIILKMGGWRIPT